MNPLIQLKSAILPLLITFALPWCLLAPVAQAQTNNPPIANAGPDQTVFEHSTVTLDGTGSYDPDGDSLTYHWDQIGGTFVTVVNPNDAQPAFVAPHQPPTAQETLRFSLTVTDQFGATSTIPSMSLSRTFTPRPTAPWHNRPFRSSGHPIINCSGLASSA